MREERGGIIRDGITAQKRRRMERTLDRLLKTKKQSDEIYHLCRRLGKAELWNSLGLKVPLCSQGGFNKE